MPAKAGVQVATVGFRRLARDLRAMNPEAGGEMRELIRSSVGIVAARARARAPVRTGRLRDSIKPAVRGTRGAVVSRLPYAPVHEFGGEIRPHGGAVRIRRREMVHGAIREQRGLVERDLQRRFDALARRHGWH